MNKRNSIADVAMRAKVSVKTVSRVLNREPYVREETIQKVNQAIKELKYTPNASARSLRSMRSYNIGLIYSNPSPYYITEIQAGTTQQCKDSNYDILIHPCNYQSPDIIEEISSLITNKKVDGLILTPPLSDMSNLVSHLSEMNAAFVCISSGHHIPDSASIYCDERDAAREITEYLVSLGHRDIAFIMSHPDHGGSQERYQGFRDALAKKHIDFNPARIKQGYFSVESGRECADELLLSKSPPSAIFASNDDMAVGAIIAAQQLGLNVPDDLSVVGFDDSPIAEHIWPRLTTMRQPIRSLAMSAVVNLVEQLSVSKSKHKFQQLKCELSIRESARIFNKA